MYETVEDVPAFLNSLVPRERLKWPEAEMLWNASTLHQCYRLQILRAKGIQLAISDSILRKFSLRKAIHEAVEDWIAQNITPVMREYPFVDKENRITGICDVLLPMVKPKPALIEIKTFRPYQLKRFQSGKQQPYWLLQLDFYYKQACKHFGGDVQVYSLLINVEDGTPWVLEHNPADFPQYEAICEELNSFWDADLLPPLHPECGNCPLKTICTEPIMTISEWVDCIVSKHRESPEEWQMLLFRDEEEDAGCIADGSN